MKLREELALTQTVVSTVAAAGLMLYHSAKGDAPFQPEVLALALASVYGLYLRFKVTPVSNPKDKQGRPLGPPPIPHHDHK